MSEKTSILEDKLLIDVDWNDENLVRLSRYEPNKYHINDAVNKVITKLKELADAEPQKFDDKLKLEAIERLLRGLEDA